MTPIMLAATANTELIVFTLRLLMIMAFVGFTPAAIDRDPEKMNIIDPQNGASKSTDMNRSETLFNIIIIPKLKFMKAIITCIAPRTLGSPFKNFSLFLFHICDFITEFSEGGAPPGTTAMVVCASPCMVSRAAETVSLSNVVEFRCGTLFVGMLELGFHQDGSASCRVLGSRCHRAGPLREAGCRMLDA